MTIPAWVTETIRYESDAKDEEILDCQVLKENPFRKIAVVATKDRHFVVHQGLIGGEAFHVNLFDQGAKSPLAAVPEVEAAAGSEEPVALPLRRSMSGFEGDVHPVIEVEGIGETYTERLEAMGIADTRSLWAAETDAVAEQLDASPRTVARWQSMAELISLNGIGPQYAELLTRSGVDGIDELAEADPASLLDRVRSKQKELKVNIQGNVIGAGRVTSWINLAREQLDLQPVKAPEPTEPLGEPGPEDLTTLDGIGPKRVERLGSLGINSFQELAEANTGDLASELSVPEDTVAGWQRQVDLTAIDGIGPKRSQALRDRSVRSVRELVTADAARLARALDVTESLVTGWQKSAIESVPGITDLTEVKGIGAARALDLLEAGIATRKELAEADPETVARALDVSPKRVKSWQSNA